MIVLYISTILSHIFAGSCLLDAFLVAFELKVMDTSLLLTTFLISDAAVYGAFAGNSMPSTPLFTMDAIPPTLVASTGTPKICASQMLFGELSI